MSQSPEQWQPYFNEDDAQLLVGKRLLVGITHRNQADEVTGYEQFHGEVVRASRKEGIILKLHNSTEERWLPPDLSVIEEAAPSDYRLKSTGRSSSIPITQQCGRCTRHANDV
jgi:hypothetical protein